MQQQNLPENQTSPNQQYNSELNNKKGKNRLNKLLIFIVPILVIVVIILQIIDIVLTANPPYLQNQTLTQQVMAEVTDKAEVNPLETPVVSVVANADELRQANSIQGQVYEKAQNGDFVLGYSDKMVIYRRDTGEIIYDGESPGTILNRNQQELQNAVIQSAVSAGVITNTDNLNPQLSVVTDPTVLQSQDPDFYKNAQVGDVIAIFPTQQVIMLVRSGSNGTTVISAGEYNTVISTN